MPCTYDETPSEKAARRRSENEKIIKEALEKDFNPLLCSACRSLEQLGYDFDLNPALSVWWDQHKREDAERATILARKEWEDRILSDALKKPFADLSPEEMSILKKRGYFK